VQGVRKNEGHRVSFRFNVLRNGGLNGKLGSISMKDPEAKRGPVSLPEQTLTRKG